MVHQTLFSTKKTFYYNFFPTKAEEDSSKGRTKTLNGLAESRVLIEIRDIHTPQIINLDNPWIIKRTLNHYEPMFGKIVLCCNDAFEHVIRYWNLDMANYIALGQRVGVALWDLTEDKNPKEYKSNDVYLQMMANDDCVLSCMELIKDRKLKVDDEICLYWDCNETGFRFKLLL